eukprot:10980942-Ditylum_brightwellii.AAC.1
MMTGRFYWRETKTIHISKSSNNSTRVYKFKKSVCTKTKGLSVKPRAAERVKDRNEMSSKLNPGDWMLFEIPELDLQPVWPRRAVVKEEWGQPLCMEKQRHSCCDDSWWSS